jgi:hypothetical protein
MKRPSHLNVQLHLSKQFPPSQLAAVHIPSTVKTSFVLTQASVSVCALHRTFQIQELLSAEGTLFIAEHEL